LDGTDAATPSWISPDLQKGGIRELPWLPATDLDGVVKLTSANKCRGTRDQLLVGRPPLVMFDVSDGRQRVLGWQESIPDATLLARLEAGIQQRDRTIVDAVLAHIQLGGGVETRCQSLFSSSFVVTSCGEYVAPQVVFGTGYNMLRPHLYDIDRGFWRAHRQLLAAFGVRRK
jgi:hypothetical protein